MDFDIVEKDAICLAGMTSYGTVSGKEWNEDNFIGGLWKRFMEYWMKNIDTFEFKPINPDTMYEVTVWDEEGLKVHSFSTFVGVMVESFDSVPFELETKMLPANKYAFLTLKGRDIVGWQSGFYNEDIPKSGHRVYTSKGYGYEIVAYEKDRFYGLGKEELEKSEIDVYVPLSL